jgi:DNA repair exonuclease SbcCD ATPase subunit
MALRALTPSGAAYCSECGADAPGAEERCAKCNRRFEGVLEAVRCTFCAAILFRNATECYHCGHKVPPAEAKSTEEGFFEKLLDSTRQAEGGEAAAWAQPAPDSKPAEGGPPSPVFHLPEPFQRILLSRKKRIEQMDALVARARRRIRMLEASNNPVEVRERGELKRQVEEILVEREDILRIEEGIGEMERVYRNILQLQQSQLRDREDSLKSRVDAFQKELERREQEKEEIKRREADLNRREDEFRSLMDRLHEREHDLDSRETRLGDRIASLEEKSGKLAAMEDTLRKRTRITQGRGGSDAITIQAPDAEVGDLQLRLTDLEEQMEKVTDEKNRLQTQQSELSAYRDDVKAVLKILDELLAKLPEEEIKKFAKSKDFSAYEKVLESHGL